MNVAIPRDLPVLVTGGSGFIGSHLVDAVVSRGARVTANLLALAAPDASCGRAHDVGTTIREGLRATAAWYRGYA